MIFKSASYPSVCQTPLWLVESFAGFNNNTTTNPTLNRKKIKDNFKDDFGVVCKALSPPPKRPSTLSAMTSKLKPSSFQHRHEVQFKTTGTDSIASTLQYRYVASLPWTEELWQRKSMGRRPASVQTGTRQLTLSKRRASSCA